MKAKDYFPVVLFIMLYEVAVTFDPRYEILKYDHYHEIYRGPCHAAAFIVLHKVVLTF